MPIQQKDFILRLIEELGVALRELRNRLLRGGAPVASEIAGHSVAAQEKLFGALAPTLRSVDPATAASLVTDARQLRLWIELIELEAEARRLAGDADSAGELSRRSAVLTASLREREMEAP